MKQPSSSAFFELAKAIDKAIDATQWTRLAKVSAADWFTAIRPRPQADNPEPDVPADFGGRGLLGGLLDPPQPEPRPEPKPDEPFEPDTHTLDQLLATHAAARWLASRPQTSILQQQVVKQAKARPRFAEASAKYRLCEIVAFTMGGYLSQLERGMQPRQPSAADWRTAIEAISTLKDMGSRGVPLWAALNGPLGEAMMPFDWLDQLRSKIEAASRSAPRKYIDDGVIEREATKFFVGNMLSSFDHAPPSMVVTFASMIGYTSQTITRTHLPGWVRQYRSGTVT